MKLICIDKNNADRGYTVLNMIQIRKPCRGEKLTATVRADDKAFDC